LDPSARAPPASRAVSDPSGADFQRLADAITALSGAREPDEIIEIVRRSARGLCGAQGVAVILRDSGFCRYLAEDSESPLWAGQRFPLTACISGWAMIHNQTVSISDIFADPRIPHDAYRPTFVKSLIMTPIGAETPFAAIGAYWSAIRLHNPDETAVLQALARSAATAFKNVELYASLRKEAARAEILYRQARDQLNERKKVEEHLRLVVNELNHRVKNSLATVQAVASQTFRSAATVDNAEQAFSLRLQALSLIHEMLTEANWDRADLREIVRRTLHAHVGPERARVDIQGPSLPLAPKAATALAMGLNELATNALKYGALSNARGRIAIHWSVTQSEDNLWLSLEWAESDGPPVVQPTRRGFGRRLLERALPADLEGEVRLRYAESGLNCAIVAPLSAIQPHPGGSNRS
jgi:two-component sensor histidine kinase